MMDRLISFLRGVAMMSLLAVMVAGYWAVGSAPLQALSSCEEDPYCHVGTKGSHLLSVVGGCDTPNCNTWSQWCCIDF